LVVDKVMNIFHNYVMNYQRVTVSLPKNIYEDLISWIGKGKVSKFVAEATEDRLLEEKLAPKDPVEAFFAHRKNLPKLTTKQILAAIHKGRT